MPLPTTQSIFDLAIQHHRAGRLAEAEQLYRQILAQQPDHAEAVHNLGMIALQVGQNDAAMELFQRAVALNPNRATAHYQLGNILKSKGQIDEAIAAFRRAIVLRPDYPVAYNDLGTALRSKGQLNDAMAAYLQAIALKPTYAEAFYNLGNALRDQGQITEAAAACRQAIALRPNFPEAHNNLGNVLRDEGKIEEAIAEFRLAIAQRPNFPEACSNLGNALKDSGDIDEAIIAYRQAVELSPNYAEAHYNLGTALSSKGQLDEAIAAFHRAIALRPDFPEVYGNLGNTLKDAGQLDQAIAAFGRAIALRPDYVAAYNNLGNTLKESGRLDDADAALRQAVAIDPNDADAQNNLGSLLKASGHVDDAIAAFRRAAPLSPGLTQAHSNLILTLHYHPDSDTRSIAEELGRWNAQHAERLRKFITAHPNDRNPDRRLRVGYVSPDLKNHPVGRSLLLLFQNHDRRQFEIYCYSDVAKPDAMTERLRASVDSWRNIAGVGDAPVAQQIREDGIDVLIDPTAHTGYNRLTLFARKPAPVQATWVFSTGVSAIEYRLTDRYLDPPEEGDESFGERPMRLPHCFWCSEPIETSVEVGPLPALATGRITFACFNNFAKINSFILGIWIEVLKKVGGSRLMLRCPPGNCQTEIRKRFEAGGIEPDRLEFVGKESRPVYLERYNRVDICLDPAPFPGHTTSLDILWMGVPLVTLAGKTSVGRGGVSILSNVGLTELIARTPEEYISIAVKLAEDLPKLAELRLSLRQRVLASPLFDARSYARDTEAAYRQMWRNWCKTAAPEK